MKSIMIEDVTPSKPALCSFLKYLASKEKVSTQKMSETQKMIDDLNFFMSADIGRILQLNEMFELIDEEVKTRVMINKGALYSSSLLKKLVKYDPRVSDLGAHNVYIDKEGSKNLFLGLIETSYFENDREQLDQLSIVPLNKYMFSENTVGQIILSETELFTITIIESRISGNNVFNLFYHKDDLLYSINKNGELVNVEDPIDFVEKAVPMLKEFKLYHNNFGIDKTHQKGVHYLEDFIKANDDFYEVYYKGGSLFKRLNKDETFTSRLAHEVTYKPANFNKIKPITIMDLSSMSKRVDGFIVPSNKEFSFYVGKKHQERVCFLYSNKLNRVVFYIKTDELVFKEFIVRHRLSDEYITVNSDDFSLILGGEYIYAYKDSINLIKMDEYVPGEIIKELDFFPSSHNLDLGYYEGLYSLFMTQSQKDEFKEYGMISLYNKHFGVLPSLIAVDLLEVALKHIRLSNVSEDENHLVKDFHRRHRDLYKKGLLRTSRYSSRKDLKALIINSSESFFYYNLNSLLQVEYKLSDQQIIDLSNLVYDKLEEKANAEVSEANKTDVSKLDDGKYYIYVYDNRSKKLKQDIGQCFEDVPTQLLRFTDETYKKLIKNISELW